MAVNRDARTAVGQVCKALGCNDYWANPMLIYDANSPTPRCLRMFVVEKKLELPAQTIGVAAHENHQPAYLAINPAGQVPALRCDDGHTISEGGAIAEYLEELHPAPPGATAHTARPRQAPLAPAT